MISDVDYENVLRAMAEFDRDDRSSAEWAGWENRQDYKYAIAYDGRKYPVKHIMSKATGMRIEDLDDDHVAKDYLETRDFEIIDLHQGQLPKDLPNGENITMYSWSRFIDMPDLIGRKKVDASIFKYGSHIPLKFVGCFEQANGGYHLKRGESKDITLCFEGKQYKARLVNIDRKGYDKDTVQIRWDGNRELKDVLKARLGDEGIADGGLDEESYIDFVKTEVPFRYIMKIINNNENDKLPLTGGINQEENYQEKVPPLSREEGVAELLQSIAKEGYTFEPWQIAAYLVALRTKPFVILAGVSGTGKTKLPTLISRFTGGVWYLIPVRPDWTDSSDVIGYCDLQGEFRPGALLSVVRRAANNPEKHFVCIMDEMNLARVEHYFAEILSQLENRQPISKGRFSSGPLVDLDLKEEDATKWGQQGLPANLAIVGTVNMDESAYGFSRKVLDRAFTLEFSEIHLETWENEIKGIPEIRTWPVELWTPRAINLNGLQDLTEEEKEEINRVIMVLTEINSILIQAQLQVAYRVRDEIALFALHAREIIDSFITRDGVQVNPLDLALQMKILPRIIGGSTPIRKVVLQLLGWAVKGSKGINEEYAQTLIDDWDKTGRPTLLKDARYPRTAARLCLMWERLINEGFTSYWM